MKKVITFAALGMAAFSIIAASAFASPGPVSTGKAACKASGQAVVNVQFTYTSPDSGLGGNDWANDTINRQIQIWKVAGGYCASIKDQGTFVTLAGTSPGNTGTVSAGITGKMKGGYTTTVLKGALTPNGLATKGNLGTFDHTNRPSFLSYGLSGDLADWGWQYQTANNGSWVNASTPPGNTGDITAPNPSAALILVLDAQLQIQTHFFLGIGETEISRAAVAPDGDVVFVGTTSYKSGAYASNHGENDVWLQKMTIP